MRGGACRVAVVGTGYVGLVSGAGLGALGHEVRCVDVREERVKQINAGEPPFHEDGLAALLREQLDAGRLRATTDLNEAMEGADVSLVAVGTPADVEDSTRQDVGQIEAAVAAIGACLRASDAYHVVAVKSTVLPGTTGGLVREALERAVGRRVGDGYGLAMNPEFLREANAVQDFMRPDRVVIGEADRASGDAVARLYARFDCPVVRTSLVNAELIKYASNALLATLISYSNQLAAVCEAVPGGDVDAVLDAVHLDRRFSPEHGGDRVLPGMLSYLRAGPGYGGSCFPKDVDALRGLAHGLGVDASVLDAVVGQNRVRPSQVVALLEREAGTLRGKIVAVLGLAFKPGTDDVRESPGVALLHALAEAGCVVRGYDPLPQAVEAARVDAPSGAVLTGSPAEALGGADVAVIATSWPELAAWDWASLCGSMASPVVMDTRQVLGDGVLPAGARLLRIGRG